MATVILVIHLILALAIILLVLLQRSEGGGLGIGGGGGAGGLATAGQTANILTRTTAICAGLFFVTSLTLAVLAGTHRGTSVLDQLDSPTDQTAPAETGDNASSSVDSSAPTNDKEVPRADDEQQPQNGAPSAPISQ